MPKENPDWRELYLYDSLDDPSTRVGASFIIDHGWTNDSEESAQIWRQIGRDIAELYEPASSFALRLLADIIRIKGLNRKYKNLSIDEIQKISAIIPAARAQFSIYEPESEEEIESVGL